MQRFLWYHKHCVGWSIIFRAGSERAEVIKIKTLLKLKAIPTKSHHHDYLNMILTRTATIGRADVNRGKTTTGNQEKVKAEVVSPKEESTDWLSSTKRSALKRCLQVALYRPSRLYLGIYVCISVHKCTWQQLMEMETMNCKESKEGFYGHVWGDEREGRMVLITL